MTDIAGGYGRPTSEDAAVLCMTKSARPHHSITYTHRQPQLKANNHDIVHSAKKSPGHIKVQFSQTMLHIRQIKSFLIMWSRWMLFILIPNLKQLVDRLNNRVLIISMETGYDFKSCNLQMKPFNGTVQVIDEQICVLMNGNIRNFSKRTCLHSNG